MILNNLNGQKKIKFCQKHAKNRTLGRRLKMYFFKKICKLNKKTKFISKKKFYLKIYTKKQMKLVDDGNRLDP